jgi:Protein of unknown function DUF262
MARQPSQWRRTGRPMQQAFHSRNYSIRDFEEWNEKDELVLQPKFQRRGIWSDKARSYLMDTIIRGKPIPKIYMRQDVNPKTRRARREIVDGQQRLQTVLSFLKDGFKISKSHHETLGGKAFSSLDPEVQKDILKYEFVVDLLQDMPDSEVYNVFARINTYSETLKAQELRNAKWFGDFKSCVYLLAEEFTTFFIGNKLFTEKAVLRMSEAEYISDLLLAMHDGIQAGAKGVLDAAYKKYDDEFPSRRTHEKRFRETMDSIAAIFKDSLPQSEFSAIRLFYPLFCAVYHFKFGLPKLTAPKKPLRVADYPKVRNTLENVDGLISRIKDAESDGEKVDLSADDTKFYDALTVHWVHADKRVILTQYLCRKVSKILGD